MMQNSVQNKHIETDALSQTDRRIFAMAA